MKQKRITLAVASAVALMSMSGVSLGANASKSDQTSGSAVNADTTQTAPTNDSSMDNGGQVGASDEVIITARKKRNNNDFESSQNTKTMDQDQIRAAGAVGGVARAMALVPGVSIQSYGNTGSQKTTFSINGIKAGWAGFTVSLDNGSLGVTFDGVPMVNPGNGLWQSTLIPQSSVLQTMGVTYGPGEVKDRWYSNIGGSLNFVPLQPSATASAEGTITYGSFNSKNVSVSLQTGNHDGWESVLFAGGNKSGSYMTSPDGFDQPSRNYAVYGKTRKTLENGDISFGAYASYAGAWRPLPTPVNPISGTDANGNNVFVTTNGWNKGGALFSEQTSGFYNTLNQNVNSKYDSNQIQMLWSKINLDTGANSTFHNMVYFDHEERLHSTGLHDYAYDQTDPGLNEYNNPLSYVLGDKLSEDFHLQNHEISIGGYGQYAYYHSREQLYSNLPGIGPSNPDGNYFSDIWSQFDTALFVQDTYSPTDKIHVTPGVRLVNYNIDFTHNEPSQFPNATGTVLSQYPDAQKKFTRLEPSLGVNWQALPWLAPFASYEMSFRQPENGGGGGPYVTLDPAQVNLERGDDYQGGAKMHWDQWGYLSDVSATIAYSHLIFSNETLSTALASGGSLFATGKSVYDALNIYADAEVYHNLYTFLNFGAVNAKFNDYANSNGIFHNVNVANTPDYNYNIGVYDIMHMSHDILAKPRLTYIYTGSQYMFDNSQNITSSQKIPGYGIFNASMEFDIPDGDKILTATIEADNLLNNKYNAFEYISAGGAYGGNLAPNGVGVGSVLALPGAPRAIYITLGMSL